MCSSRAVLSKSNYFLICSIARTALYPRQTCLRCDLPISESVHPPGERGGDCFLPTDSVSGESGGFARWHVPARWTLRTDINKFVPASLVSSQPAERSAEAFGCLPGRSCARPAPVLKSAADLRTGFCACFRFHTLTGRNQRSDRRVTHSHKGQCMVHLVLCGGELAADVRSSAGRSPCVFLSRQHAPAWGAAPLGGATPQVGPSITDQAIDRPPAAYALWTQSDTSPPTASPTPVPPPPGLPASWGLAACFFRKASRMA